MSTIRDQRVKLTSEILTSIRVIKYQAWEAEFQSRINSVRSRELETYRTYVFAAAIGGSIYTALPIAVAVVTFATYVGLGIKRAETNQILLSRRTQAHRRPCFDESGTI